MGHVLTILRRILQFYDDDSKEAVVMFSQITDRRTFSIQMAFDLYIYREMTQ